MTIGLGFFLEQSGWVLKECRLKIKLRQKRSFVRTTCGTYTRVETHPINCNTLISNVYCCNFFPIMQRNLHWSTETPCSWHVTEQHRNDTYSLPAAITLLFVLTSKDDQGFLILSKWLQRLQNIIIRLGQTIRNTRCVEGLMLQASLTCLTRTPYPSFKSRKTPGKNNGKVTRTIEKLRTNDEAPTSRGNIL